MFIFKIQYGLLILYSIGLVSIAKPSPLLAQSLELQRRQDASLQRSPLNKNVMESTQPGIYDLEVILPPSVTTGMVTFTITEPLQTSGPPDPFGTNRTSEVSVGAIQTIQNSDGPTSIFLPAGTTELAVNMRAIRPVEFFGGTYTYNVTLSVTLTSN